MFKQQHRLQGKEVRFLTRKRQVFAQRWFAVFFVDQYPNRPFFQISFHVPLALSKRAVIRHKIKRILIQSTERLLDQLRPCHYAKLFVNFRGLGSQTLIPLIQQKKWDEIIALITNERTQTFTSFLHHHGKSSSSFRSANLQSNKKPFLS